jgi:hypothetical protein
VPEVMLGLVRLEDPVPPPLESKERDHQATRHNGDRTLSSRHEEVPFGVVVLC